MGPDAPAYCMDTASTDLETMQAARLHGPGDLRLEKVGRPAVDEGFVRLRMRSVGICGSDLLHFREGSTDGAEPDEPFVLGHEIAAEVLPSSVDRLGIQPGTLVAVDPARPCERCEWCRRGDRNLCPHVRFMGLPERRGGLAEELAVPRESVVPVPEAFTPDEIALLEPLGVALHAVDLAEIKPMETVAVLGAGPIGLLVLQVARAAGAGRCFVVDSLRYRADRAVDFGADRAGDNHRAVEEWTDGQGVDVVIEASNSPDAFDQAVQSARIGGRIVLVGIPSGDEYALTASRARRKGLTVKWSRRMGDVYSRAIDMVTSGHVDLKSLVTHRFPLQKAPQALALQSQYEDEIIKAVVYQDSTPAPDGDSAL